MTEDHDWERLGSSEPYFAVLTESRFLKENLTPEALDDFYRSGEADVERLVRLAGTVSRDASAPRRALEFGCGAGRMTLAMASRAGFVTGIDASPSLLRLAEEEAARRAISNVRFLRVEELESLDAGTFDFVYSYIVFQHIPVEEGERYLRTLLKLAAPDAIVALHFALSRRGGPVRRFLRMLRTRSRIVHRMVAFLRHERNLPYMQMNPYDRRRIEMILAGEGFRSPLIEATDHGGIDGGIFVAARGAAAR